MPPTATSSSSSKVDGILARIKRSTSISSSSTASEPNLSSPSSSLYSQPPEEASLSLGRQLASSFFAEFQSQLKSTTSKSGTVGIAGRTEKDESLLGTIVTNPSCACTFFSTLAATTVNYKLNSSSDSTRIVLALIHRWKSWIPILEQKCWNQIILSSSIEHLISLLFSYYYSSWNQKDDANSASKTESNALEILVQLYHHLILEENRLFVLQHILIVTSRSTMDETKTMETIVSKHCFHFMTPVLTAALLTSNKNAHSSALQSYIYRHCRTHCRKNPRHIQHILSLQIRILTTYIHSNLDDIQKIDHGMDGCVDLLESCISLSQFLPNNKDWMMSIVQILLEQVFPICAGCTKLSMVLEYLIDFISSLENSDEPTSSRSSLSETVIFRMGVCLLSTPREDEIDLWLQLCLVLVERNLLLSKLQQQMIWILACIFSTSSNPNSSQKANQLLRLTFSLDLLNPPPTAEDLESVEPTSSLLFSFHLLSKCTSHLDTATLSSSTQSALLFYASLYLLPQIRSSYNYRSHSDTKDNINSNNMMTTTTKATTLLLQKILTAFPSLNIRFFPIALSFLSAHYNQQSTLSLDILTLLCQTSCKDLHCTRQLWHFLHAILPSSLQSTVIRLYPHLLQSSSSKLSSKIISELSAYSQAQSMETRLSVAATVDDLCYLQRNYSFSTDELIGIIQTYLFPIDDKDSSFSGIRTSDEYDAATKSFLMSLAIRSLHHLCQNGILEYKVMYKVLKKRMGWKWVRRQCEQQDIDFLLEHMDVNVLYELTTLLGDGEVVDVEHEKEQLLSNAEGGKIIIPQKVSAQVEDSVRFLLFLSNTLQRQSSSSSKDLNGKIKDDMDDMNMKFRYVSHDMKKIQSHICKSLNNYSLEALGLEFTEEIVVYWNNKEIAEEVEDVNQSKISNTIGQRYMNICKLILYNLTSASFANNIDDDDCKDAEIAVPIILEPIVRLSRKILDMEENILGSHSLWKATKKSKDKQQQNEQRTKYSGKNNASITKHNQQNLEPSKEAIQALPSPTLLSNFCKWNPNGASASAALLCLYDGSHNEKNNNHDADDHRVEGTMEKVTNLISDIMSQHDVLQHPCLQLLSIWSYVSTAQQLWMSETAKGQNMDKNKMANTLIQHILSMKDKMNSPDGSLILLTSLSTIIQHDEDLDFFPFLQLVNDTIWDNYNNSLFSNDDEAYICLSMLGVSYIRNRSWNLVDDIIHELLTVCEIDTRKRTLKRHASDGRKRRGATTTRTNYFGGYIGLGIVLQYLGYQFNDEIPASDQMNMRKRMKKIVGYMLGELIHSLSPSSSPPKALLEFIDSLKGNTKIRSNLLETMTEHLKDFEFNFEEGFRLSKFKSLSLALGLGSCSLKWLNIDIYRGVLVILRTSKAWLTLPQAIHGCMDITEFDAKEIVDSLKRECSSQLETPKEHSEIGDVLYALVGISCNYSIGSSPSIQEHEHIVDMSLKFISSQDKYLPSREKLMVILTACTSLVCLPAFGCNGRLFFNHIQMYPVVQMAQVTKLVKALTDIVGNDECDEHCRAAAIITTGALSSMKTSKFPSAFYQFKQERQSSEAVDSKVNIKASQSVVNDYKINLKTLPRAKDGTLLCHILALLEELIMIINTTEKSNCIDLLIGLLSCMTDLTLPGSFATVIESILRAKIETENHLVDLKLACVKVLIKQIERRHRGTNSDETFVNLHIRLSNTSPSELKLLLGERGMNEYLKSLVYCLPRYPSGIVGQSALNLWKLSVETMERNKKNGMNYAVTLLNSISLIQNNTTRKIEKDRKERHNRMFSVSAEVILTFTHLITTDFFSDLKKVIELSDLGLPSTRQEINNETSQENSDSSAYLWYKYLMCLKELPIGTLENQQFFTLKDSTNSDQLTNTLFQVNAITFLASEGYFDDLGSGRGTYEVDKARSWLTRQKTFTTNTPSNVSYRQAFLITAMNIALTSSMNSSKEYQKDCIFNALEVILVVGFETPCLELLAIQVTYWFISYVKHGENSPLFARCFNGMDSISSPSAILLPYRHDKCNQFSPSQLIQIGHLCLQDMPLRLAFICRELGIVTKVFSQIMRITDGHSNDSDKTGKLKVLRELSLYFQNEDTIQTKYITSISTHLMS